MIPRWCLFRPSHKGDPARSLSTLPPLHPYSDVQLNTIPVHLRLFRFTFLLLYLSWTENGQNKEWTTKQKRVSIVVCKK